MGGLCLARDRVAQSTAAEPLAPRPGKVVDLRLALDQTVPAAGCNEGIGEMGT